VSKRNTSAAGYDDGAFGAYVRQLGDLTRLSVEEEVFHATNFSENRRVFLHHACWFPAVLGKTLRQARQTEVSFNNEDGDEDRQTKRERLASLIATVEAVTSQFSAAEDDPDGDRRRELAAATLTRAIGRVQLAASLCHQLFSDLHACALLSGLPAPEQSPTMQLSEVQAKELLHYRAASTPEAWKACIPSYQAMQKARDVLVESNLRLVVSVCKKYRNCGLPYADLVQEGNIGLVQAVDRFEPERGHRFSTYAVWWIRQSITAALSNHGRTIRIPANMAASLYKIRQAEQALLQSLGREPSPTEIAERIDMAPQRVSALRKMEQQTISLQSSLDDDSGRSISEIFEDESSRRPDEDLALPMLSAAIDEVLHTLNEREQAIITARFGLNGAATETLESLSHQFGVSYERIRQIEAAALKKMRHPSVRHYFDGYA
jgi:RNA polymerase primary sigma factor